MNKRNEQIRRLQDRERRKGERKQESNEGTKKNKKE